MRIITQVATGHNDAAARLAGWRGRMLILLTLVLAGCSQETGQKTQTAEDLGHKSSPCDLATDTSAWTAFKDLADRITAQGDVPREDLDAFGALPSVTLWRNSLTPTVPSAQRVGNWLEGAFWQELGRQGRQKLNANRAEFMRSYRYSLENRQRIDQRIDELTGPRKCDVQTQAEYWIEAGLLPDALAIHFLPAKPEIRIFEDALLVDTGVVGAGSVNQLIRQMTGLLYRNYQYLEGPSPADLEGGMAVAHFFRVLMNEGVAGWIDQTADTEFDKGHPSLSKFQVVPEHYFIKTQEAVKLMNLHLRDMLDNEETMVAKAQSLVMTMGAMNAYGQTGYGMASVIEARLGKDRLRASGRSVPAFVAAYQEAASMNPDPLPEPGALGVELYQTVPPLDADVFAKLHPLLLEYFPE